MIVPRQWIEAITHNHRFSTLHEALTGLSANVFSLQVSDSGVDIDLDTPEDYLAAQNRSPNRQP